MSPVYSRNETYCLYVFYYASSDDVQYKLCSQNNYMKYIWFKNDLIYMHFLLRPIEINENQCCQFVFEDFEKTDIEEGYFF